MTRLAAFLPTRRAHAAAPVGDLLRNAAADLSVLATFASIFCLFTISPFLLERHGMSYLTSGGGLFAKLHPATFLAAGAFGLRCLAHPRPFHTAWRLATSDRGVVLFAAAIVVTGIVAIVFAHSPVTQLVDTFALPCLIFLMLRDLDPSLLRWLAILVGLLLCANAAIALAEVSTGWRLVSFDLPEGVSADPTRSDVQFSWQAAIANEWRATALLGHPLVNGLTVGVFVVCLLARGARWIPAPLGLSLAGLQYLALFAFAARAALVATAVLGAFVLLQRAGEAVERGWRISPRSLILVLAAGAVLVVGLGVLIDSGVFDRVLARFGDDAGSAETRRTMFELFGNVSFSDLVLLPDQEHIATLQQLYGLEFGIESSWLGLALAYGLVVTTCLVIGLLVFARSVVRHSGAGASAAFVLYFILVSVAANLTTKVLTLAMTVSIIMLFLPPLRRARGTEEASWR